MVQSCRLLKVQRLSSTFAAIRFPPSRQHYLRSLQPCRNASGLAPKPPSSKPGSNWTLVQAAGKRSYHSFLRQESQRLGELVADGFGADTINAQLFFSLLAVRTGLVKHRAVIKTCVQHSH